MSQNNSAIRRVVTTHDADGKAIVLSDGDAPNVRTRKESGITATLLWTTDSMPATYSNADRGAVQIATAPPPGHSVLRVVEFPPEDPAHSADNAAVLAEMGIVPSAGGRHATRHPHMHATDSVDYAIVIEGEIDMLLDDSEVHLKAGDILVQQGTNHAWVNRGQRPCKIAFVLIDAAGAPIVPTG
jgi:mannose-6-phosphate isomerase-like protein (cupin superfamily)